MGIDTSVILAIAIIASNFLISRGMDIRDKARSNEKFDEHKNFFTILFKFKDDHLKDSANTRLEFSKQLSVIAATVQVNQEQYMQILKRIEELRQDFNEFRGRERRN